MPHNLIATQMEGPKKNIIRNNRSRRPFNVRRRRRTKPSKFDTRGHVFSQIIIIATFFYKTNERKGIIS
jgi:hypothetical protein